MAAGGLVFNLVGERYGENFIVGVTDGKMTIVSVGVGEFVPVSVKRIVSATVGVSVGGSAVEEAVAGRVRLGETGRNGVFDGGPNAFRSRTASAL